MKKLAAILIFVGLIVYGQLIGSVSPSVGAQGDNLTITIFGSGFVATPTADFGAGISITSVTYFTPSLINVNISISPTALLGFRDVIITNPGGGADTVVDGFEVVAETDPPTVFPIFPPHCGMIISCHDTSIIIGLFDENGIDDTTLQLVVDGITYTSSDPEVVILGDSLLYFFPTTWFTDGDTIDFSILRIADTFGNVAIMPIVCSFIVDTMPPALTEPVPPMNTSIRDLTPTVLIPVTDNISGVDSTSFELTIITPDGDTITYHYGDMPITWDRDTFVWEAGIAGLSFEENDTIIICFSASDLVGDDGCGANSMDTCWLYWFHVPPPADVDLIIDQVYTDQFPLVSAFCLVMDEYDNTIAGLDESNFTVDEDYGASWINQYPIIAYLRGGGGMADIVFCIDITGSMYTMMDDVVAGLHDFAESLAVAGISYRLGMDSFGDSVYFPYGYELTGDIATFEGWVTALHFGGGGDGPEVSLDAIMEAVDSMHFRYGATIVTIMVTDAAPHYIGSSSEWSITPPEPSHYTPEQVYNNLIANRVVSYVIADTDWYSPSEYYYLCSDSTGGQFFGWSGAGDFNLILPLISESIRGGYMVTWSSAHPIADCTMRNVKIKVGLEGLYGPISDQDQSQYLAPCSPIATIIEPLPDTWTSDSLQGVMMSFAELDDSVNSASILFMVNGSIYNTWGSPQLIYTHPFLNWTAVTPFTNNQMVGVELVRLMDSQGNLPFTGPIHWNFRVDLLPPRIANQLPAPGEIVTNHQQPICFDIWDNESGLNWDALLVGIDCAESRLHWPPLLTTLSTTSAGVTISGNQFCWDPSVEGFSFKDRDTVCITLLRVFDSPDYGEPNELPDSLTRWCFYIPDDDTLCPEFSIPSPDSNTQLPTNLPFTISDTITDESGVWNAWIEYDTDGSVDDGTFETVPITLVSGDLFSTDLDGQPEMIDFVYRICACDADTDNSDYTDSSCCCSDVMPLYFGFGPQAEIIEPKQDSTSTNYNQRIVMRIFDDDAGVDTSTIRLEVAGNVHNYNSVDFSYIVDTMIFTPPPSAYFTDGESVEVALLTADDFAGNHLRGGENYRWKFFVDLTPPVVLSTDPIEGQIIEDNHYDIVFDLNDHWRRVDSSTISIGISSRTFDYGDAGVVWDPASQVVRLIPENADPELVYPNGDTVCATITCADIPPDYGMVNNMTEFQLCFIFVISTCDCRPTILTPNGDGINDIAYFQYPRMIFGNGIIHIYEMGGEEIWASEPGATTWNCHSSTGHIVSAGIYMYSIIVDEETVCSGTLTVVR